MIVRSNPAGAALEHADMAWFDSDASTNIDAIREIDAEAARHGLVRTHEHWLQTLRMPDGRTVRRGFCYRPEPWGFAETIESRREGQPNGTSAAEIIREMRD